MWSTLDYGTMSSKSEISSQGSGDLDISQYSEQWFDLLNSMGAFSHNIVANPTAQGSTATTIFYAESLTQH